MTLTQAQIFKKFSAYSLQGKIYILSPSCVYRPNSRISLYYILYSIKLHYINWIEMTFVPGFESFLFFMV